MSEFIIILVISGFICGCFTAYLAIMKGYNEYSWFLWGLLFNLFALIAAAGLPININKSKENKENKS